MSEILTPMSEIEAALDGEGWLSPENRETLSRLVSYVHPLNLDSTWVCAECGSDQCEETAWVTVNTGEERGRGSEGPMLSIWCPTCETHGTELVTAAARLVSGILVMVGARPLSLLDLENENMAQLWAEA